MNAATDLPRPVNPDSGPVLLFDGECGLCQRVVRSLWRRDRLERLRFAPLQGPTAQAYLRERGLPTDDFDSLVFVPDWSRRHEVGYLLRTDGALAALRAVGGLTWLIRFAQGIPRRWRDAAYRAVARWRYRLFGRALPEGWPAPDGRARFL